MTLQIARIIVFVLGYFIVTVSLIPLIRNDNWIFRIFEYPRAQKLFINVFLLVTFFFIADWNASHSIVFACLLSANALYLFYQVFPYTFFSKRQLKDQKVPAEGRHFKLLICNVYQDNRDASRCLGCIEQYDPDIIILVETDSWWKNQLSHLEKKYKYTVMKPLENTYGMLLYSRLKLVEPEVRFLVESDIPSIRTKVRLPSGELFQLYSVHPQPPVPQENPRSTERDAELLLVAKEAKTCKLPVVVAGDLNDVAWSYTTELFMKISGLLDPRRGRGFYNTFHAYHWFLRWPLDHIFCSEHFHLTDLQRLPMVGSDHFPMYVELALNHERKRENARDQLKADAEDVEVAEEKIEKAR
ncbi:MAG TPA: endonuclease/exonuclease/phosphatase family protein [Chryseosolibacter sp.]|nr:endonuclease/exonuclease/phosphatase family protein [Chryseosolibacter sp.]